MFSDDKLKELVELLHLEPPLDGEPAEIAQRRMGTNFALYALSRYCAADVRAMIDREFIAMYPEGPEAVRNKINGSHHAAEDFYRTLLGHFTMVFLIRDLPAMHCGAELARLDIEETAKEALKMAGPAPAHPFPGGHHPFNVNKLLRGRGH